MRSVDPDTTAKTTITMKSLSGAARIFFATACVLLASIAGATESPSWQVFNHERVLGTSLELKFATPRASDALLAEAAALAEIDRLDKILSGYDTASEFRRWAATRNEAIRVSPELFEVLALFDTWRERTGGALDASAEVAGRLWKTAAQNQRVPSAEELATAIRAVQQRHWRLDRATRTATHLSDAPLMLNSFAKSYIADQACAAALSAGHLTAAVVNLGGDLVIRGDGTETVGIADPQADGEGEIPLVSIAVKDRAVATSGGYRRGVEIAGHWYSHLVDPRTGRPVDHVSSATVVGQSATDAGALATALCVMSAEEGLSLVTHQPGVECLLVMNDGRRLASAGWKALEKPAVRMPVGLHAAVAAGATNAVSSSDNWDPSFELAVNLEIAATSGGRGKRPFLAVWIEDKDGFPVRTVALWYHGARWLPDLRAWSHADSIRAMAEGTQIADSVASATRGPGKYTIKWDGKDSAGRPVRKGRFTVAIEVAREHGTRQLIREEIDFSAPPSLLNLTPNVELASASFEYRRKATRQNDGP
jgi:thiamine biosynthesis lipoprotein ApbE